MMPETLTCAENIAPGQLSALRDDGLPAVEAQRLRAHVAGCPACRARLADYDALATTLRQQRELEPGERIVEGVRARLADTPGPSRRRWHGSWRRPSRRLWAGLATLAPVAAIILLFVYVFGGLAGRSRPATGKTPTIAPAPTITTVDGKPIYPTATPATVSLPPMTPAVSADAAWGTLTPAESFRTPSGVGTQFIVNTISPDATTLAGEEMPSTYPTSGWPQVNLVTYDFASQTWKTLGPHWQGDRNSASGGASSIDSRYIIYGYNDGHGQTCGVCHNSTWAYDRQTGNAWEVDPKKGELSEFESGDHVVIETASDMQFVMVDLATRSTTPAIPQSEQTGADIQLAGFSWPYLIYEYQGPTPSGQSSVTTLRLHNELTNTTVILPEPLEQLFADKYGSGVQSYVNWAGLVGDTLYFTSQTTVIGIDSSGVSVDTTYGSLYRVSHFSTPGGVGPEFMARWQNPSTTTPDGLSLRPTANARLIALDNGDIWDIVEGKLVQSGSLRQSGVGNAVEATISGNYLLLTSGSADINTNSASMTGAVYDTSTLPIH